MRRMKAMAVTGIAVVAMTAGMLAGCGDKINGADAAITVNGETINMGTANFLLRYQQAETTSMMESYGMTSDSGLWSTEYSSTSSGEPISYGEEYKDSTQENIVTDVLLRAAASDYDVTISDELQASIESAAKTTYEQNQEAMDAMGTTEADIVTALQLETYKQLMRAPLIADTDREVADEDAAQTTITYARISLTTTDDNGDTVEVSEEELETYRGELEDLLEQIQSSDDVAAFDIDAAATEIDEDNITVASFSYGDDDTILPDDLKELVTGMSDGEVYGEVIRTSNDYYYIVRLDAAFDEEKTQSKKDSIVAQRESDNYSAKIEELNASATVETTDAWKSLTVDDQHVYTVATEEEAS